MANLSRIMNGKNPEGKKELRITFRAEVYLTGDNLDEIKQKWEDLPLFSADALDAHADYVELISVEDAETYEDLTSEFYH